MPDVVPFQKPADSITVHATVALAGGTFCAVTGVQQADGPWTVGLPAAGGRTLGVVMRDLAIGDRGLCESEGILPVIAGAALVAGQEVMTDAAGHAIPWVTAAGEANRKAGVCMTDTANGALAPIKRGAAS